MKLVIKRTLVIGVDVLLLLFFGLGIFDGILHQDTVGLMTLYITGTAVSGFLLVGWLIRAWRDKLWFWRTNLIWTIGWSLYFLMIFIMVVVAINQLSSLG